MGSCLFHLKVPIIFDEICYFWTSVDIRPLPGAWVAELLGVIILGVIILGVQDHKKVKFPMVSITNGEYNRHWHLKG